MNRRHFAALLAASAARAWLPGSAQGVPEAEVVVGAQPITGPVPANFTGLSYESAQLANPEFFSPRNHELVKLFRGLSPSGNLRLGGGSSEFTTYADEAPAGPPPFEVFGPDTSKTAKHGTTTSALALRNLRGFLDATGWSCLYGLNLGQGTAENAVREAAAATRLLGPRLLALQIGNEPDSFRNRYRPASYGPEDYVREWTAFHDAIAAAVPGARFAGPDISNKLPYLTAFAAVAPRYPDVVLLTAHYYAMGPARSPDATVEQLLSPDPKTATLHARGLPEVEAAIAAAHLPFRMSEANSCWDGGKPGVSDVLAAALWCVEASLRFAGYGWAGVNWHGGGSGWYSPIAGTPSAGFTRRPEYFGIQFAQAALAGGARVQPVTLNQAPDTLAAYALSTDSGQRVVLLNRAETETTVRLPSAPRGHALRLTGPALLATTGVVCEAMRLPVDRLVTVPPHTALLLELNHWTRLPASLELTIPPIAENAMDGAPGLFSHFW